MEFSFEKSSIFFSLLLTYADEPTNALDEQGLIMLRNIVQEEKKRGALILLASHSRYDIDLLSDEIIRIDNGRLI